MNLTYLAGLGEIIRDWFSGILGAALSIVPKTLYFLCTLVFQLLDIIQILVRKVAGLDTVYYESSVVGSGTSANSPAEGDIALKFITEIFTGQNSILSNIFWAFIILAFILLVISTFVAVLRSEYKGLDEKATSKSKIIGNAFRAVFSFAIVPIVCFFGIFLANIILKALDTVTAVAGSDGLSYTYESEGSENNLSNISNLFDHNKTSTGVNTYVNYVFYGSNNIIPTTSTPISGLIFQASAYRANRIRYYSIFRSNLTNPGVGAGIFDKFQTDYESAANFLDECFANTYVSKTNINLTEAPFEKDYLFPFSIGFPNRAPDAFKAFDKNNVMLVWYYYDLWSFDFIVCIGALFICAQLLVYLALGLIKRLFELIILFLISPPIASLMPLDEGNALKKWKDKFIAKTISAFGPIIGLNLFFVVLPLFRQIRFFNIASVDSIVNIFFVIAGLVMVKDLVGTISEFIGGENSINSGETMAGDIGSTVAKVGKAVALPTGLAVKGIKGIGKGIGKVKKGIDKKRQKNALNAAALEHMTDEEKDSYAAGTRRLQKKRLRKARTNISDKQKQEYLSTYKGGINLKRAQSNTQKSRDKAKEKEDKLQEKANKAAHETAARMSAFQAYAMDNGIADWTKLTSKQKKSAMKNRGVESKIDTAKSEKQSLEQKNREYVKKRNTLKQEQETAKTGEEFYTKEAEEYEKLGDTESAEEMRNQAKEYKEKYNSLTEQIKINDDAKAQNDVEIKKKNDEIKRLSEIRDNATTTVAGTDFKGIIKNGSYKPDFDANALKDAGANLANGMASGLKNALTQMMDMLGGKMAEGFKSKGSWKEIGQMMLGKTAKEIAMEAEIKNQKKIAAAQKSAGVTPGGGSGGAMELSDKTIEKLADAITKKSTK